MIPLTSNASWQFVMGLKQSMTLKYAEISILLTKRKLFPLPEKPSGCLISTKLAFHLMVDGVKK